MFAWLKRGGGAGRRIGVFATAEGVAAAEIATGAANTKPRLLRCVYEPGADAERHARIASRIGTRGTPTVAVLDPGAYSLLLVEAPDVPADELRAAVRWRITDLIDYHADDAVIDVFEMPPHARGGKSRMMYAVTARAEAVRREVESAEGAGLELDVVDIPELGLRNVAARLEDRERGAAQLYVGAKRSTLLLVRQGLLYLARHIDTGSAALAAADGIRDKLLAGLALEVRRSLDYFESHYEQTSIPALHASGLEDEDRERLAAELTIDVHALDVAAILETTEPLTPELQRRCLPAIGAALRHDPVVL
jgi:MSHA biogenesis protein MshI